MSGEQERIFAVPCSTCGAEVGKPCLARDGTPMAYAWHAARYELANGVGEGDAVQSLNTLVQVPGNSEITPVDLAPFIGRVVLVDVTFMVTPSTTTVGTLLVARRRENAACTFLGFKGGFGTEYRPSDTVTVTLLS